MVGVAVEAHVVRSAVAAGLYRAGCMSRGLCRHRQAIANEFKMRSLLAQQVAIMDHRNPRHEQQETNDAGDGTG
jgi:hypothetical protein